MNAFCLVAGVNLCLIPENWSNSTVQKNLSALFLTDHHYPGWYIEICDRIHGIGVLVKSNHQKITFQVEHIFKHYGPGVKYIHFVHCGKDLKWWGAQFGWILYSGGRV